MDRHANDASPVRRAREAAGLSREGLAFKAGVSLKTIERIEGGHDGEPRRATMAVIADALGMTVEELTAPSEPLAGEAA